MVGRPGPRPERWKYKDPDIRKKYIPFLRAKAQAAFRNEEWTLTFEDWLKFWTESNWALRGKSNVSLCLTRKDYAYGWHIKNVEIAPRIELIRRQHQARKKEL